MMNVTKRVWGAVLTPVFHRAGVWLLALAAVTLGVVWLWASTVPVLSVTQVSDGQVVFQSPVHPGSRFTLTYIHSIHRTPVEEIFFVNENKQMVLDAMVFESYGVGMPTSLEGEETFRMADGKMRIEHIDRTLDTFELRIGQVIADHKLLLRGEEIPLSALSEPGSAVRFEIDRLHVWEYVKGGLRIDR
ncbi:DUF1850 domain-containing protein [Paenibacillus nanensis]|uniref:DUF1850 domain-containing protein n=1 Tax=Paenibacillus nanensis TaxID=393251 RepID=A0A3A1UUW3_9BACL|nr:DUF1850 domain-containing protein [Paenibacillus nanensis]RIX52054.1 DUF1850 domain-containing protein [Paenibacillus nanensis]